MVDSLSEQADWRGVREGFAMDDADENTIPEAETRRRGHRRLAEETRLPDAPVDSTQRSKGKMSVNASKRVLYPMHF
jgi:hypothetical protein